MPFWDNVSTALAQFQDEPERSEFHGFGFTAPSVYQEILAVKFTEVERRIANDQSLASAIIEGHCPSIEFLADSEAVIKGDMTTEEAILASLNRARRAERAASLKGKESA